MIDWLLDPWVQIHVWSEDRFSPRVPGTLLSHRLCQHFPQVMAASHPFPERNGINGLISVSSVAFQRNSGRIPLEIHWNYVVFHWILLKFWWILVEFCWNSFGLRCNSVLFHWSSAGFCWRPFYSVGIPCILLEFNWNPLDSVEVLIDSVGFRFIPLEFRLFCWNSIGFLWIPLEFFRY